MAHGRQPIFDYLRRLAPAGPDGADDAGLLERFALRGDESAFAALLERYGPMVLGVCSRMLGNACDAEDAFQATFLVLVRRAGAVSKRSSVGSWLYGVAVRVAARARQRESLRRARERAVPARTAGDALGEVVWRDVRPVLDEEVARLPEKYRRPVVLCYLEGRTNDEAALLLGCPRGTVATRLARARERLRRRLAGRGLALSAGALAALLSENLVSAAVPAALARRTAEAVLLVAGGTAVAGAAPTPVAELAEGVLRAMSPNKLVMALAVALALVLAGGGSCAVYLMAQAPAEAKKESPRPAAERAPEKEPDRLTALMRERLEVAQEEMKIRKIEFEAGKTTLDLSGEAVRHLLKAELELASNKEGRVAALEKYVQLVQQIADVAKARHEVGRISPSEYAAARYLLLDAKIDLEREKARK